MHFDNIQEIENMIDSFIKEDLKEEINNRIIKRNGNIDAAQKDFMNFINDIKKIGAEIFEDKRRENYEKAEAAKELERQRQLKAERQRKEEATMLEEEAKRRREAAEAIRRQREAKIDDILETVQEKLKNKTTTETPKKSVNAFDDELFNIFLSTVLGEILK